MSDYIEITKDNQKSMICSHCKKACYIEYRNGSLVSTCCKEKVIFINKDALQAQFALESLSKDYEKNKGVFVWGDEQKNNYISWLENKIKELL